MAFASPFFILEPVSLVSFGSSGCAQFRDVCGHQQWANLSIRLILVRRLALFSGFPKCLTLSLLCLPGSETILAEHRACPGVFTVLLCEERSVFPMGAQRSGLDDIYYTPRWEQSQRCVCRGLLPWGAKSSWLEKTCLSTLPCLVTVMGYEVLAASSTEKDTPTVFRY